MGRGKEFSGVTGNFCPEDPETRIAEELRVYGHSEQVCKPGACLVALSSMLLLDESQQFPGRTQMGILWVDFSFFFSLVFFSLLLSCYRPFIFPPLGWSTPLSG